MFRTEFRTESGWQVGRAIRSVEGNFNAKRKRAEETGGGEGRDGSRRTERELVAFPLPATVWDALKTPPHFSRLVHYILDQRPIQRHTFHTSTCWAGHGRHGRHGSQGRYPQPRRNTAQGYSAHRWRRARWPACCQSAFPLGVKSVLFERNKTMVRRRWWMVAKTIVIYS